MSTDDFIPKDEFGNPVNQMRDDAAIMRDALRTRITQLEAIVKAGDKLLDLLEEDIDNHRYDNDCVNSPCRWCEEANASITAYRQAKERVNNECK